MEVVYPNLIYAPKKINPLIIYPNVIYTDPIKEVYLNPQPYYVDVVSHVYGNYPDLENDKDVIKTVTKYYYYKIIRKWLRGCCNDLLGYLKVEGDTVKFIDDLSEYKSELAPSEIEDKKIKFIEDKIISRDTVRQILEKFVKKNAYKWYKLQNHEEELKMEVREKIKRMFENIVKDLSKK